MAVFGSSGDGAGRHIVGDALTMALRGSDHAVGDAAGAETALVAPVDVLLANGLIHHGMHRADEAGFARAAASVLREGGLLVLGCNFANDLSNEEAAYEDSYKGVYEDLSYCCYRPVSSVPGAALAKHCPCSPFADWFDSAGSLPPPFEGLGKSFRVVHSTGESDTHRFVLMVRNKRPVEELLTVELYIDTGGEWRVLELRLVKGNEDDGLQVCNVGGKPPKAPTQAPDRPHHARTTTLRRLKEMHSDSSCLRPDRCRRTSSVCSSWRRRACRSRSVGSASSSTDGRSWRNNGGVPGARRSHRALRRACRGGLVPPPATTSHLATPGTSGSVHGAPDVNNQDPHCHHGPRLAAWLFAGGSQRPGGVRGPLAVCGVVRPGPAPALDTGHREVGCRLGIHRQLPPTEVDQSS